MQEQIILTLFLQTVPVPIPDSVSSISLFELGSCLSFDCSL